MTLDRSYQAGGAYLTEGWEEGLGEQVGRKPEPRLQLSPFLCPTQVLRGDPAEVRTFQLDADGEGGMLTRRAGLGATRVSAAGAGGEPP